MRPRTITVDISRGGAWALRDYRRQSQRYISPGEAFVRFAGKMTDLLLLPDIRWWRTSTQEDTDGS